MVCKRGWSVSGEGKFICFSVSEREREEVEWKKSEHMKEITENSGLQDKEEIIDEVSVGGGSSQIKESDSYRSRDSTSSRI